MDTTTTTQTSPTITTQPDRELYVIPETHGGYSCLGFDVVIGRYDRLAAELINCRLGASTWIGSLPPVFPVAERGTILGYQLYQQLLDLARRDGRRLTCELSPQLIGLEGHRVEVSRTYETHKTRDRFIVGKSTGWLPCHLEIARRTPTGGMAADRVYVRVVDLGKVR